MQWPIILPKLDNMAAKLLNAMPPIHSLLSNLAWRNEYQLLRQFLELHHHQYMLSVLKLDYQDDLKLQMVPGVMSFCKSCSIGIYLKYLLSTNISDGGIRSIRNILREEFSRLLYRHFKHYWEVNLAPDHLYFLVA